MAAHLHPGPDIGPGEAAIAAAMMLKPVYDRLSALLGQAAGLLLLTTAGADPQAERLHLISLRAQYAEIEESLRRMAPQPLLAASDDALRRALPLIGEIVEALANRPPEAGFSKPGACCWRAARRGWGSASSISPAPAAPGLTR